jgi:predicted MFS family arabinose efflux permease
MVLGACGFGLFTMFWTALTFLLSSAPYGYPTWAIGLFGIAGLAGALAAQRAGRFHDRGLNTVATGIGWVIVAVSWALAALGGNVLALLIIAIVGLDIGVQGQNILNQSRVFAQVPEARSRSNSAYITGNFIGGAIGSVAATTLWAAGGWTAVCTAGFIVAAFCLVLVTVSRRGALGAPVPT